MPEILEPAPLDRISPDRFVLRYFLDEEPGAPPIARALPQGRPEDTVAILIGPEGGWSAVERQRLTGLWKPVSLGGQILRAETAALAALAVLMNLWQ